MRGFVRNTTAAPILGVIAWAAVGLGVGCADELFEPRRETIGRYTVVWLKGTPYELGYQHGQLLRQELAEGVKMIEKDVLLQMMFALATAKGYHELARQNSYPWLEEECRGLVDAVGDTGWTMDQCLVLNFGDAITEWVRFGEPKAKDLAPGCTQFAAGGAATADGRLYHGRVLDWSKIDFIIDHPVIFVRQPDEGVPHVVIGFPGNLSPYQGINAEGIAVASNDVFPRDNTVNDRTGRSHVQLVGELLGRTRSLDEVRAMVASTNHMTAELLLVSDGDAGRAEVLEMTPQQVGILELQDGLVYATNHFRAAETKDLDEDALDGSASRLTRLDQLLLRGKPESLYGKLTPGQMVAVMRDRTDPTTGTQSDASVFSDGKSIATNGALYDLVFDPAARLFWVAAGGLPVPSQPFTGFSLGELLELQDHDQPHPTSIP